MKLSCRVYEGLLLLLAFVLVACSDAVPEISYLPGKVVWSDSWLMVDEHGDAHKAIGGAVSVSAVVNDCFSAVNTDDKVSVYRFRGDGSCQEVLSGLRGCGFMTNGLIPLITGDGCVAVADGFGRVRLRLPAIGGRRIMHCSSVMVNGLLWVSDSRGLWGAVDMQGNMVVDFRYGAEPQYCNGYALGIEPQGGESFSFSIIDSRGEVCYKFPDGIYPLNYSIKGGMIACEDSHGGKYLITLSGTLMPLPSIVAEIKDYTANYVIFSDSNGMWGIMTIGGEIILRPKYSSLSFGVGDELLASNSQKYFLVDYSGYRLADFDGFDEVVYIGGANEAVNSPFCYLARDGALWTLFDRKGRRVGNDDYVCLDYTWLMSYPEPLFVNAPVEAIGFDEIKFKEVIPSDTIAILDSISC